MKITDILSAKAVCAKLTSDNKKDVISELVDNLIKAKGLDKKNKTKIVEVLMAREALGSTAIGQGIAIPHGKCGSVKKLVGCLGISKTGINFESLDGEPAHIFFLLLAPIDSAGPHLKALARISKLLKDKNFRDALKNVEDEKTLLKLVEHEDNQIT